MVGRERLAIVLVCEQYVIWSSSVSGRLVVNPCSAWITANRADGFGTARLRTSLIETPSQLLSNRLQRVTQWMSECTCTRGRAWNSVQVQRCACSTSPSTRSSHFTRSTRGTEP